MKKNPIIKIDSFRDAEICIEIDINKMPISESKLQIKTTHQHMFGRVEIEKILFTSRFPEGFHSYESLIKSLDLNLYLTAEKIKNGVKHGPYKRYYSNNQIMVEGFYYKNIKSGPWKTYHENGQLAAHGNFHHHLEGSKYSVWFREPYQSYVVNPNNSIPVGKWEFYHDNGSLHKVINYRSETETTELINENLSSNDHTLSENFFRQLKHGTYLEFNTRGNLIREGQFINGQIEGQWIDYYTPHLVKRIHTIRNFNKGNLNGEQSIFNIDGSLRFTIQYNDGKRNKIEWETRANGEIRRNEWVGFQIDDIEIVLRQLKSDPFGSKFHYAAIENYFYLNYKWDTNLK